MWGAGSPVQRYPNDYLQPESLRCFVFRYHQLDRLALHQLCCPAAVLITLPRSQSGRHRGVAITGLVTSGQLLPAVAFLARHPDAIAFILALSLAATLGAAHTVPLIYFGLAARVVSLGYLPPHLKIQRLEFGLVSTSACIVRMCHHACMCIHVFVKA